MRETRGRGRTDQRPVTPYRLTCIRTGFPVKLAQGGRAFFLLGGKRKRRVDFTGRHEGPAHSIWHWRNVYVFCKEKNIRQRGHPEDKKGRDGRKLSKGRRARRKRGVGAKEGSGGEIPRRGAERRTGPGRGGAIILGTPTERKGEGPKVSPGPVERKAKSPAEILRFSRKGLPILFR